jgi:hypothetical protein
LEWVERLGERPTVHCLPRLGRAAGRVAASHEHPTGDRDAVSSLARCDQCVHAAAAFLEIEPVWEERRRQWCALGPDGTSYSLADCRAAAATGVVHRLSASLRSRWFLRLGFEIGLIDPAVLRVPSLPADAQPARQLLYESFLIHYALRATRELPEPVPFARSYAMAYSGLTERLVRGGLTWLEHHGFMVKTGRHEVGCKSYDLWLPGGGSEP